MTVSKTAVVARHRQFLRDHLCEEEGERLAKQSPMGSESPREGEGILTSRCHFFVFRDGSLDCPPFASELIRRPPVPARVVELAPDDLALIESEYRVTLVGSGFY
jgi:hypothetical protein